jgi:uncharacterized protein HemX
MKMLCKKCVLVMAALIIGLGTATAISGCKKKEASPLQQSAEQTKTTAEQAKKEAAKTAEQAKQEAAKTAEQAKKQAEKAAEPNK